MGEDPVAHLLREVQLLGDPQRLLVVAKAAAESLVECLVERLLAGVAERWMAHVVTETDRLHQVLVQAQRPRNAARDRGRLECVGHPGPVVIAGGIDEHLRLAFQAAERLRVEDAVAVALERRAKPTLCFFLQPATRFVRADGEWRQPSFLMLSDTLFERVRHSAGDLGHRV